MIPLIQKIEAKIKTDPYNHLHYIAIAKAYMEEGDEERARKVVAAKRNLPSQDPSVHLEWGKLCEELGMVRQARESYEKAIALDPDNPESHFRVALLYYEKGVWERALKHLQRSVILSPQNLDAQKMLASLYDQVGFTGSARAVQGSDRKIVPSFQTISLDLSEEDIAIILNLFQGREFGYARYHLEATGTPAHSHVQGTLGFKEICGHLRGEETYGVYQLRGDRALKFACIHVGIPWRKVVENTKNTGFLTLLEDKVQHYAREILEKAREYGIPAYLENSGARDQRVWFFFAEFIPLELAQRFLNVLLDKIRAPFTEITLSLFLGIKGKGIGYEDNPVMLPLGLNPRTGRRCFFTDDYGEPYEDQLLGIRKIRSVSRREIQGFIKIAENRRYDWVSEKTSDSLRRLEKNCPVIGEIKRKAGSGRMLSHEEKMVVFFTVGFLKDDFRVLHSILEPCPDYRPKKVDRLASRLKSNPISCPKIRELLPETTAYLPCNCSLTVPEGGYPTPLLHVNPGLVPVKEADTISPSSLEELMKRYRYLLDRIDELRREKEKLELLLQEFSNSDRIEEIKGRL
ncbi:MAG: tetratricopeptide repeat protein [Deltaproteobacteria bacterium]|nr:tetratricopeptide repeat protein [Deltaproteobacteria bacterium]